VPQQQHVLCLIRIICPGAGLLPHKQQQLSCTAIPPPLPGLGPRPHCHVPGKPRSARTRHWHKHDYILSSVPPIHAPVLPPPGEKRWHQQRQQKGRRRQDADSRSLAAIPQAPGPPADLQRGRVLTSAPAARLQSAVGVLGGCVCVCVCVLVYDTGRSRGPRRPLSVLSARSCVVAGTEPLRGRGPQELLRAPPVRAPTEVARKRSQAPTGVSKTHTAVVKAPTGQLGITNQRCCSFVKTRMRHVPDGTATNVRGWAESRAAPQHGHTHSSPR
jgi:hypothetical protein